MKPSVISADVLFEDHRATLRWHWVAGLQASERRFDEAAVSQARSGADLVGYLNYIHPYRLQILGEREVAYLSNASPEDCARRIARIGEDGGAASWCVAGDASSRRRYLALGGSLDTPRISSNRTERRAWGLRAGRSTDTGG